MITAIKQSFIGNEKRMNVHVNNHIKIEEETVLTD